MVAYGHADITGGKFPFTPAMTAKPKPGPLWPTEWVRKYDKTHGWLTISFDLGVPEVKDDFDLTKPQAKPLGDQLCQPATMCAWNKGSQQCQCNINDKDNY